VNAHAMPFGAALADGSTRFRLWAPAAGEVEVVLGGGDGRRVRMARGPEGWFETRVPAAGPGTRYAFAIDGGPSLADPASRFQPEGIEGPSEVIDPSAFPWTDSAWRGRPWHETVLYELHLGAFTPGGDCAAARERLDHLAELGVTAIELMPVADCPGARNWGYDGVLPVAPAARYGRPEELKALVDAAHARGLMVLLDVVYNHFGPQGNHLARYAPEFFTSRRKTPWGDAIAFERRPVREFFVHNALYWLEEFHMDGLRLDAVHAIDDPSQPDILSELAARVRERWRGERHVHLVLENDRNEARRLARDKRGAPRLYTAQWNDDVHHALHVLLTGEREGYYADYAEAPARQLGRCLTEGFAYQGEASEHRGGEPRGEPSAALPPTAFVAFLQNHDQVGNRAFGERITALARPEAVRAALAVLLLAPSPPLLFMGEEWGSQQPFCYFCDFEPDLAARVREGRRREFERFAAFRDPEAHAAIPDPCAPQTFASAVLRWPDGESAAGRRWLALYRELLALRRREIAPRLREPPRGARYESTPDGALAACWRLSDGAHLALRARLAGPVAEAAAPAAEAAPGRLLFATPDARSAAARAPWSVGWWLAEAG
jgi:maltooligosyltrehalose trehalohydrolase